MNKFLFRCRMLILFVTNQEDYLWQGVIYAVVLALNKFAFCVVVHWWLYGAYVTGMKARSILNGVVYRKVRPLSNFMYTHIPVVSATAYGTDKRRICLIAITSSVTSARCTGWQCGTSSYIQQSSCSEQGK